MDLSEGLITTLNGRFMKHTSALRDSGWRRGWVFVLITALLLAGSPLRAEDSSTGFPVTEHKDAKGVTLAVESTYDTEFTLTLNCQLTNATSSQPMPLTVDSAGRQTFELV